MCSLKADFLWVMEALTRMHVGEFEAMVEMIRPHLEVALVCEGRFSLQFSVNSNVISPSSHL